MADRRRSIAARALTDAVLITATEAINNIRIVSEAATELKTPAVLAAEAAEEVLTVATAIETQRRREKIAK